MRTCLHGGAVVTARDPFVEFLVQIEVAAGCVLPAEPLGRRARGGETTGVTANRLAYGGRKCRRRRRADPRVETISVRLNAAGIREYDGDSGRHRLERPDAERFARVRMDEHVAARAVPRNRGSIEVAAEENATFECVGRLAPKPLSPWSVACDDEAVVRALVRSQKAQRLDEELEVLFRRQAPRIEQQLRVGPPSALDQQAMACCG